MSAMYVPSKRKTSRPRLKLQTPEVLKTMKREVGAGVKVSSVNEEASYQKTKKSYGRKKYHDLQPVFLGPAEGSTGGSGTSVVQSNLTNGSERQVSATGHVTVSGIEENVGPSIAIIRDPDLDTKKKRKTEDESQTSLNKYIEEVKQTGDICMENHRCVSGWDFSDQMTAQFVPVIVPVAQYTQKSPAGNSAVTQQEFSYMKKEVPSYPPGSQEERWQLQILSKGRVNCPKCKSVGRKTVEGLKKHMATCTLHPITCQQCGKQLKTSTGMKYHLMADHSKLPIPGGNELDDQEVKEKLRKVLKRMGRLKCSKEGCTGSFTSIMGYVYHMKKCGKEESELAKLLMNCKHCGKAYRSRAGLEYHLKSEHGPVLPEAEEEEGSVQREPKTEHASGARVKRTSAQVAIFHLREIASQELLKEWPKRKVQRDLVPDDRKLRYSRPGLPAFSQEVLRKWKNEVKLQRNVQCPNKGCGCYYTSVSGLKAHLGLCTLGDFQAGKYKCLICKKEFNSESGVKYHINSVHSQDWFVVTSKTSTSSKLKTKLKDPSPGLSAPPTPNPSLRFPQRPCTWQDSQAPACEAILRVTADPKTRQQARKKATQSRKDKETRQGKCYEFSGSDSHSSSCGSGSSSSESEAEDVEAPRHDAWALNRPVTPSLSPKRSRNIL